MTTICFSVLLLSLCVVVYNAQRTNASGEAEWFSIRPRRMLRSRTVFRLKGATPDECAVECISMRGRCLSFDYHRRTRSCFGRRNGDEVLDRRHRPHVRRNENYDFYVSSPDRINGVHRTPVQPGRVVERPHMVRPVFSPTFAPHTRPPRPRPTYRPRPPQTRPNYRPRPPQTRPTYRPRPPQTRPMRTYPTRRPVRTTSEPTLLTTPAGECRKAIGLEHDVIPDENFNASSSFWYFYPSRARLNGGSAWMSNNRDTNQMLEIKLGRDTQLAAIGTQGYYYLLRQNFVKTFEIYYENRRTNGRFTPYKEAVGKAKVFKANTDSNSEVVNLFKRQPFIARTIRIQPLSWQANIVLRVELYVTCDSNIRF